MPKKDILKDNLTIPGNVRIRVLVFDQRSGKLGQNRCSVGTINSANEPKTEPRAKKSLLFSNFLSTLADFDEILDMSTHAEALIGGSTMFHFSPSRFVQYTIAGACLLAAASQVQAQAILATSTTSTTQNKQAWHDTIPAKLISAKVTDGILVIDGMVVKVKLNYSIDKAGYMYFFVPGTGTAVVSLSPMGDSFKVKNAFDGDKLTFTAEGHQFELTSKDGLGGKNDVYVHFDRSTMAIARTPRFGFGDTTQAPYEWPASKASAMDKEAHLVQPPALPASALPQIEDKTSTISGKPAPQK
jgi:hypothetical protein